MNDDQKTQAELSLEMEQTKYDKAIVTEISPFFDKDEVNGHGWWRAEKYHQQYLEKGGQCSDKGETSGIRCYG